MSPEVLTITLAGVVVAILVAVLLRGRSDRSIAAGGGRLQATLEDDRLFAWAVVLLGLVYFTLQAVYSLRMPLADDEFAGAKAAYRVIEHVPYRDFAPYKTVLGYYIQALPLLWVDNLWAGILSIRLEMTVINTLAVLFAAFRLRRHFRGLAVCLALAMLVVMSTFLERSFVLRVDMLGSVCGLLSLVFILERRPGWAGALAGLGFQMSQKSVYFILAGGVALGSWWLVRLTGLPADEAAGPRQAFRAAARFAAAAFVVLAAYFTFFSTVGSFDRAVGGVARTSVQVGLDDQLFVCEREFWAQTLRRNPGFYGGAAIALATLALALRRRPRERDWLLATYGAAMVALCVWHKQPCPPFFVVLIPTLFVLLVDLFDRLASAGPRWPPRARVGIILLYLVVGLTVPLSRLPRTLARDNGFQAYNVALAEALLQPGDGYLAGLPVLYDREQAVPELAWLDDNNRMFLRRKSLDELRAITTRIDRSRVKLIVMNYRIDDVPQPLTDYFRHHYTHFWGNVFLYSPLIGRGPSQFRVVFDGTYRVDPQEGSDPVILDGQQVALGQLLRLTAGSHTKSSEASVRLRFMPEELDRGLLEPRYHQPRAMFAFSFHY